MTLTLFGKASLLWQRNTMYPRTRVSSMEKNIPNPLGSLGAKWIGISMLFFAFSLCACSGIVQGEEAKFFSCFKKKGSVLSPFSGMFCAAFPSGNGSARIEEKEHKECGMIINHNLSAINAHRVLKFSQWAVDSSMAKLSSGMRINRAGDDPSGLAVSEKMRTQIQGLRQAERNAEDGLSLIQTTEGYLTQVSDIVQRIRVLAIQSSNGIYGKEDRELIQVEVEQLVDEVDRISSQAEFNGFQLLQGDFSRTSTTGSLWLHMGPNADQRERVYIAEMSAKELQLRLETTNEAISVATPEAANETIRKADYALGVLMRQRADLGAYQNRLEHTAKGLMNAYENVQASESRIRDTDMAEEIVRLTTKQILSQTSIAMLAQAGVRPQSILQLLR